MHNLNSRSGIPRPIRDFPESLSQAILVGIMLVGRLGVWYRFGNDLDVLRMMLVSKVAVRRGAGCRLYKGFPFTRDSP